MPLLNVGDVVSMVAALLDDPGQTDIDKDYVIPFINLRWANLIVNMSMLGLQYTEESAVFNIPQGVTTLNNWMLPGQPLASMMEPISIDWKLQGAPDIQYDSAEASTELDDFPDGTQGIQEYSWQGGTILLNPSSVALTIRVRFKAMGTTLVDPTDNMIRGVADIISYRAAELICAVRGNPTLKMDLRQYGDTALDDFLAMSVMRTQANFYKLPQTHSRGYQSGYNISLAPSINN